MMSSPSCSSTGQTDIQEADVFSDDSGVDVKLQNQQRTSASEDAIRRNKRKSSEPKKRKDVLQMKRFRWDTDEEDIQDEVFELLRPSSGDSGCQEDHPIDLVKVPPGEDSKKKQRWKKSSKSDKTTASKNVQRLSVIRPPTIKSVENISLVSSCVSESYSSSDSVIRSDCTTKPSTSSNVFNFPSNDSLLRNRCSRDSSESMPSPRVVGRPRNAKTCASASVSSKQENVRNFSCSTDELVTRKKSPARNCEDHKPSRPQNYKSYNSAVVSSEDITSSPDLVIENRTDDRSGKPRNYKSMSRQRRMEANARERTRVHTISAAFESLRRAVPAYADNQKLSKLAILRVASAYIVALACLSDSPEEQQNQSLSDCVDQCTKTIQAEGRTRRRASKE